MRADVRISSAAEQAATVDDVALGCYAIALVNVCDELADTNDVTRKLVSDRERRVATTFGPVVPIVDMYVGSANAGAANADQNFVVTDLRNRDIAHGETWTCYLFDKRFHAFNSETL